MSRDSEASFSELRQRDRKIGLGQSEEEKSDLSKQINNWLSRLITAKDKKRFAAIESSQRLINTGIILLALLLGWLTVTGLFQYDGQGRVNLVYLMIILVGLQMGLILLTLIAMLPQSLTSWIPGFSSLQRLLKWFSPGRLQRLSSRYLATVNTAGNTAKLKHKQAIFADISKWQIFSGSQLFGVVFNLAALVSIFVLIASKDIAFGWSSTLDISSASVLRLSNVLSLPWQSWLPAAVPDLQLIEASHYFRLQNGIAAEVQPQMLGHWWPFIMLSLVFYGLIPRLILFLVCRLKLRSAYSRTLRYYPGVNELVARLNSALIETGSSTQTDASKAAVKIVNHVANHQRQLINEALILINWGGFELDDSLLLEDLVKTGQFSIQTSHSAGSNRSLEEDALLISSIAAKQSKTTVGILLKAWEPPLGELTDFLSDLRRSGFPQRPIILLPTAIQSKRLAQPRQSDIAEWQRYCDGLADPWISVIPVVPEEQGK